MEEVKLKSDKKVLKVGFIKQDLKKNFITNLAIALEIKVNFIQQAGEWILLILTNLDADICLIEGDIDDKMIKIFGLFAIIKRIAHLTHTNTV